MQISSFVVAASILATVYATPASKIFARHNECEYSGVTGAPRAKGTCTKAVSYGNNYGAGYCHPVGTLEGDWPCDFAWHNDARSTPCGKGSDSQFACKRDGDPCYIYSYSENPNGAVVAHCTNA